jgi:glutamine synthetase adenylyltransferase
MGKLGARELNVSSDIDLIYVYDHDGETAGNATAATAFPTRNISARRSSISTAWWATPPKHGFVFRVDLALRPNGNSGPAAVSLGALEEYFQVQGREWERFAWLKSRVVARHVRTWPAARRQARCARWCCPLCFGVTWTTTCLTHCGCCTARSANTRPSAAPATRARQRRQAVARRHPRD